MLSGGKKGKHSRTRKGYRIYDVESRGGARSVIRINVAGYSLHPKWHGVAHTYFVRIQGGGNIMDIPSFFSPLYLFRSGGLDCSYNAAFMHGERHTEIRSFLISR